MAKLLILTGETLSAEEALRCGLAQKIYDDEKLEEEALRLAKVIAETSADAIAAGKTLLGSQIGPSAIDESVDLVSLLHGSEDSRAAVARFLEQHRIRKRGTS